MAGIYINKMEELQKLIEAELQNISSELTVTLKGIISERGLRDSGNLINSVRARAYINTDGNLRIIIEAEDYYKYLDEKYSLTRSLITEELYRKTEARIAKVFDLYVQNKIE